MKERMDQADDEQESSSDHARGHCRRRNEVESRQAAHNLWTPPAVWFAACFLLLMFQMFNPRVLFAGIAFGTTALRACVAVTPTWSKSRAATRRPRCRPVARIGARAEAERPSECPVERGFRFVADRARELGDRPVPLDERRCR
jgi:hypothetical protein